LGSRAEVRAAAGSGTRTGGASRATLGGTIRTLPRALPWARLTGAVSRIATFANRFEPIAPRSRPLAEAWPFAEAWPLAKPRPRAESLPRAAGTVLSGRSWSPRVVGLPLTPGGAGGAVRPIGFASVEIGTRSPRPIAARPRAGRPESTLTWPTVPERTPVASGGRAAGTTRRARPEGPLPTGPPVRDRTLGAGRIGGRSDGARAVETGAGGARAVELRPAASLESARAGGRAWTVGTWAVETGAGGARAVEARAVEARPLAAELSSAGVVVPVPFRAGLVSIVRQVSIRSCGPAVKAATGALAARVRGAA
jgi:hypothetical protein